MKPSWIIVGPEPMTGAIIGDRKQKTHMEDGHVRMEAQAGAPLPPAQEHQEPQEARGGRVDPHTPQPELLEGAGPADAMTPHSGLWDGERISSCHLKSPSQCSLVMAALGL